MKICYSKPEQWKDLKNLRLASIEESPESFELTLEQAHDISDCQWQALASGVDEVHFFIAYENDEPAGIVGGVNGLRYELVALWVAPDFRECSIALALVETVKQHAIKLQHSSVSLNVSKDNLAACWLYKKCGFTNIRPITRNGKQLQEWLWTHN